MTSEQIRQQFIHILSGEFPRVTFPEKQLSSGNIRISPTGPNRKKRWMQLDANPTYLSIAMDHRVGDITEEDLLFFRMFDRTNNSIRLKKNRDAVNISIFVTELYDFSNHDFIQFLHKHYNSYLNR